MMSLAYRWYRLPGGLDEHSTKIICQLPNMPTDMASQRVGPVSPVLLFFEEAVVHMMAQGHVLDYDKAIDTDEPQILFW